MSIASINEDVRSQPVNVDDTTTKHKVYVGDNLDVLKFLQRDGLSGKVNLIYCDPPYPGSHGDTPYSDAFNQNDWINFLRPRLIIARDLLADDAVLACSIDDTHIHWLRFLLDEIFGARNYMNTIVWYSAAMSRFSPWRIRPSFENIVVYAKNLPTVNFNPIKKEKPKFKNIIRTIRRLSKQLNFTINEGLLALKIYQDEDTGEYYEIYNTITGQKDFFNAPVSTVWEIPPINRMSREYVPGFMGQKPLALIRQLIRVFVPKPDGMIIDLFAGTGTTGVATWELNAEDGGNRQFILAQSAEICREAALRQRGYEKISDILLDRLQKAVNGFATQSGDFRYQVIDMPADVSE